MQITEPNIPKLSWTKYTGSKRYLVNSIRELLPSDIETYYEPFLGTGIVLTSVIGKCKNIIGSDLSPYLMELWNLVKNNPDKILDHYASYWPATPDKYYEIRNRFNTNYNALDFYCLLRTSFNGLVRFNPKTGYFNAAFHHQGREGMSVENVKTLLYQWHEFIKENNIQLKQKTFEYIVNVVKENDFVFLDPPYKNAGGMYGNAVSFDLLENVLLQLNKKNVRWMLTYDGKFNNVDTTSPFNTSLYKKHALFKKAFSRWQIEDKKIRQESYYINY